jgi:peptidoglycan/LPS O-acetylase OafA/YrhL
VALGAVVFAGLLLAPIVAIVYMGRTALSAAFLAANLYLARGSGYFDSGAEFNPLLHTWSLSLEEQFYLIFPALLAGFYYLLERRGASSSLVAYGLISPSCGNPDRSHAWWHTFRDHSTCPNHSPGSDLKHLTL